MRCAAAAFARPGGQHPAPYSLIYLVSRLRSNSLLAQTISGGSAEKGGDDDDEEEEEDPAMLPRWSLSKEDKHYFLQDHAKLICAVLHKASNVLIAGFSNGVFGLYELPDFNNIHTLR